MRVFFYGLFMDKDLLFNKGIEPSQNEPGFVDGYELRIGERATLVRSAGGRAYGVVMELDSADVGALYAEDSVSDYVPEAVTVELIDGESIEATCYNLPAEKVAGANRDYAQALLKVATGLGFPETYLDQIRNA